MVATGGEWEGAKTKNKTDMCTHPSMLNLSSTEAGLASRTFPHLVLCLSYVVLCLSRSFSGRHYEYARA